MRVRTVVEERKRSLPESSLKQERKPAVCFIRSACTVLRTRASLNTAEKTLDNLDLIGGQCARPDDVDF